MPYLVHPPRLASRALSPVQPLLEGMAYEMRWGWGEPRGTVRRSEKHRGSFSAKSWLPELISSGGRQTSETLLGESGLS